MSPVYRESTKIALINLDSSFAIDQPKSDQHPYNQPSDTDVFPVSYVLPVRGCGCGCVCGT